MEYDLNKVEFDYGSEIIGIIDDCIELSFIYMNNQFYIEYYDAFDEDYILLDIKDDDFPILIENKEITIDEFQEFKKLIEVQNK